MDSTYRDILIPVYPKHNEMMNIDIKYAILFLVTMSLLYLVICSLIPQKGQKKS